MFSIHRNGGSAVQLLHGWCWCHVKLSGEFDGHLEWSGLLLKEISDLANFHKFLFHHPSSYTVLYETEEREVSVACFFFFLSFFFLFFFNQMTSFFFLFSVFNFYFYFYPRVLDWHASTSDVATSWFTCRCAPVTPCGTNFSTRLLNLFGTHHADIL